MTNDLIDEDDGENRAVRMFLALYGCNPGTTVGQMRQHLTMSGFPHWPEWVDQVSQAGHLTKGGAQSWLRHLFGLEWASERALLVAAKLRAMATNYPVNHLWDKLDAKACIEGALLLDGTHPKLAAPAVTGWVATSERLPAVGTRVWIAARAWNNPDGARIYGVAIYDGKAWGNPQDPEQSATWWPPTHWMPLSELDSQLSAP